MLEDILLNTIIIYLLKKLGDIREKEAIVKILDELEKEFNIKRYSAKRNYLKDSLTVLYDIGYMNGLDNILDL